MAGARKQPGEMGRLWRSTVIMLAHPTTPPREDVAETRGGRCVEHALGHGRDPEVRLGGAGVRGDEGATVSTRVDGARRAKMAGRWGVFEKHKVQEYSRDPLGRSSSQSAPFISGTTSLQSQHLGAIRKRWVPRGSEGVGVGLCTAYCRGSLTSLSMMSWLRSSLLRSAISPDL